MKTSTALRNSLNVSQQEHSLASPQHFYSTEHLYSPFSAKSHYSHMMVSKNEESARRPTARAQSLTLSRASHHTASLQWPTMGHDLYVRY